MLSGSSHGRTVATGVYLDLPTRIPMTVDWKGKSQLEKQPWQWDDFPVFGVCKPTGVSSLSSALQGLTRLQAAQRHSLATLCRDGIGQLNGNLADIFIFIC